MKMNDVLLVLTVLQLWRYCYTVNAITPEILQAPQNASVGLGQGSVTLTCKARGDNIFLRVDGDIVDHNNLEAFRSRGITFSNPTERNNVITAKMFVTATRQNNGTIVICHATSNAVDISAQNSDSAIVYVADAPLPPMVSYSVVDESTLQVNWEVPFSLAGFPIRNYTISVVNAINETDEEVLLLRELSSDILSLNVTRNDAAMSCTNLTFSVMAENSVGNSTLGIAHGSFPFRPGEFSEMPSSEVTFSQDQSAIVQINFTFPALCPYNNATYMLVIEDERGVAVHTEGPTFQHWSNGATLVLLKMREIGLELHAHYSVNITVWTSVGQTYITFAFNTSYLQVTLDDTDVTPVSTAHNSQPLIPSAGTNTIHAGLIAAACVGTVLLMLAVAALAICVIYTYQRRVKRNRACIHTTELAGHVGRGMPMVVNPIYEGGAIYEEIPDPSHLKPFPPQPTGLEREEGYVSISSITPSNISGAKCNPDKRPEEVYTMMNSVGTLLSHLEGGAAALGSPEQAPSLYSNIADEDGASAKCGWQMPKDTDPEGRYVSM